MIIETQCMESILNEFPMFKPTWEKHLAWWEGEVPGLFNDMTAFETYTVALLESGGDQNEIKKIFSYIEFLLNEGDEKIKDAVSTVFLEHLINASSAGTITPESFVHLLGKESKNFCKAWDEFSGIKTPGLWND